MSERFTRHNPVLISGYYVLIYRKVCIPLTILLIDVVGVFDNDVGHVVFLSRNVETLVNADVLSAIIPVATDGRLISYISSDSVNNIDLPFIQGNCNVAGGAVITLLVGLVNSDDNVNIGACTTVNIA